jgi:hypothetical protein
MERYNETTLSTTSNFIPVKTKPSVKHNDQSNSLRCRLPNGLALEWAAGVDVRYVARLLAELQ